jgi:CRP/FNR family transcriptional regulator, cyclic AMP receptor protein
VLTAVSERFSRLPHFAASDFGRLPDAVRAQLEAVATYRICGPNEFIYLQDDEATSLYFVRSGHIRLSYLLEDGSAILFGILPPGESFGELGVFESATHCDMATSVGTSSIYSVPLASFRAVAGRHPELGLALGRTVARRYRSYIALTRILGLKTLQARLSQCMLRIADGLNDRAPHDGRNVARIGAFVTQTELGLMARGARGNVNRALKTWERQGWIGMEDRCILILDRASLEDLILADDA